jgi:hypothetical protein
MKEKLNYKQGFVLPGGGLVLGSMVFTAGIFLIVVDPISFSTPLGIILILLTGSFFSMQGVEIDPDAGTVFPYYIIYGLKTGKKRPLSDFSNVTLERRGISLGSANYRGIRSRERVESFDLLLVNKDQSLRQFIKFCRSQYDAQGEAIELSAALNMEIAEFDPNENKLSPTGL